MDFLMVAAVAKQLGMTSEELLSQGFRSTYRAIGSFLLEYWEDILDILDCILPATFVVQLGSKFLRRFLRWWYKQPSGIWAWIGRFFSTSIEKAAACLANYFWYIVVIIAIIAIAWLLWKAYYQRQRE